MITVRFPSGFSVRYNTANFVTRHPEYSDLTTAKEGSWVAQVPNTAIIEIVPACLTYNPIVDRQADRLASLEKEIRGLRRNIKQLK